MIAKHRANNLGAYLVFLTLDKEFPQDDRRDDKGQFLRDQQADAILRPGDRVEDAAHPVRAGGG